VPHWVTSRPADVHGSQFNCPQGAKSGGPCLDIWTLPGFQVHTDCAPTREVHLSKDIAAIIKSDTI